MVKDIKETPPIDSGTDINARGLGFSGTVNLEAGLAHQFDLIYESSGLGFRTQFLGDKKSGWQGTLSYSYFSVDKFSSSEDEASVDYEIDLSGHNSGISIGYKKAEMTPYFSFGRKDLKGNTLIEQASESFRYKDTGNQLIASLGLYFDSGAFYSQIEVSASRTSWSRAESYDNVTTGAFIGGQW